MTEHDRLRGNVRFAIDEAMNTATGYGQGMETVDADRAALDTATDRVIALVRADERTRIRELMTSEEAFRKGYGAFVAAIGLTEETTT